MNGRYISDLRDCCIELKRINNWITQNRFDSNVRYLISYAVIRTSGTIERVLKAILFDYVTQGANTEAINYFTKHLTEASFNPSTGKIERILSDFNNSWGTTFNTAIKGTSQKSDLNSLIQLRNAFAHGTPITASIEDITQYYLSGVWILNQLTKIIP